jgi:hypothetical protein
MKTFIIRNVFPFGLAMAGALAVAGCEQAPSAGPAGSSQAALGTAGPANNGQNGVIQTGCTMPPGTHGMPQSLPLGDSGNYPFCSHIDQTALFGVGFKEVFGAGDGLFDTAFNAFDGVGANLSGDALVSLRFSRIPRADLVGFTNRATGPNSSSCSSCHNQPVDDGAGDNGSNAIRDPQHKHDPNYYITRNTPHVMGMGALQLLAEEITTDLWAQRDAAKAQAAATGTQVSVKLTSKGISFGTLTMHSSGKMSTGGLRGIDRDLVVKPFQWKGAVATIRDFAIDASHNEIGMDPSELVAMGVDADNDGVKDELSVGDMTTMTIYLAGTNRPTTLLEREGTFGAPVTDERRAAIIDGEKLFGLVGCAGCHTPSLPLRGHVFTEPSQHPAYRKELLAGGVTAVSAGLDPARPSTVDLTTDPALPFSADQGTGQIDVQLLSDLKRHDMGKELAENIDETGSGASVWLTKPLWGVGSTAPYLHDGRAATLTDAVAFHGGEAAASRAAFKALAPADQAKVIEFLKNLILFK